VRPAIASLAVVLALGACASKVPPAEAAPRRLRLCDRPLWSADVRRHTLPRQATWYARTTSMALLH
jgi:hypothetical protein